MVILDLAAASRAPKSPAEGDLREPGREAKRTSSARKSLRVQGTESGGVRSRECGERRTAERHSAGSCKETPTTS